MLDLAFALITGGRRYWYNAAGELIIQSRVGDRCHICQAPLNAGESRYYPDLPGFLCWQHALQRIGAAVHAKRSATAR